MNWTEGNLARHSRGKTAKNEVLRRQKQHFAKARSRLVNGGPRQSPVTISFLNSPIAKQPIHASSIGYGEPYSPEGQPRSPSLQVGAHSKNGQQPLGDRLAEHPRHEPFTAEPEIARTELSRKRVAAQKVEVTAELASREKRRKLLGRADWAGLSMQQPLELAFPGQMRAGRIWSNTNHAESHTPENPQEFLRKPIANREKVLRCNDGEKRLQPAVQHIRVQVGSQVTDNGNGSSPTRIRRRPAGSNCGDSTEISTVASALSHRSSCRDDVARQCRKSSSGSIEREHLKERDKGRSSGLGLRRTRETTTSDNDPSEFAPVRVVHGSTPIMGPIPLRHGDFQVLQWSSSASSNSGSLEVEVGQPRSGQHAMDIAENEKWKTLLNSSDHLIPLTRGSSLLNSPSLVPVLSPGIREAIARSDKSDTDFTENGGERQSGGTRCAKAPNTIRNDCGGDTLGVQTPRSKVTTLGTTKPRDSAIRNDIDENMAWMKFIFDSDSDEVDRCAIQEAARLAAREMRPSKSPKDISSTDVPSEYTWNSRHRVTSSRMPTDTSLGNSDDVAPASVTSASHIATHGSVHFSDSAASQQQLETNTTCNAADATATDDFPSLESDNSALNTVISDLETTKATIATSEDTETSKVTQRRYRFAAPQVFIGKHVQSDKLRGMQMPPPDTTMSSKRRGRRKKKALDGRMSIRELPNFDGDPIEDIEED